MNIKKYILKIMIFKILKTIYFYWESLYILKFKLKILTFYNKNVIQFKYKKHFYLNLNENIFYFINLKINIYISATILYY